jgi:hypothetical protein
MTDQLGFTEESSLAVGMSISAKVGIPDIAEVTTEMTTSVNLSNSLTKRSEGLTPLLGLKFLL